VVEGADLIRDEQDRLMYAMAIVRFVNSATDSKKTTGSLSIMVTAANIDLPLSFVDARHTATHGHLPSMSVLKDLVLKGLLAGQLLLEATRGRL